MESDPESSSRVQAFSRRLRYIMQRKLLPIPFADLFYGTTYKEFVEFVNLLQGLLAA